MDELNQDDQTAPIEDELADKPIPTYEEWLEEAAKSIGGNSWLAIAKAGLQLMKYASTRETLIIAMLLQKEIVTEEELETFFGEAAQEHAEKAARKNITKYIVREAARGELFDATGKQLDPDKALVILNDILDFNKTGYNGRTIEIMAEMAGEPDGPREGYEEDVKQIERTNRSRAAMRRQAEEEVELEARQRTERERKVRIFVSMCRVADKPTPTDEEQQQMLDGTLPIPEKTE